MGKKWIKGFTKNPTEHITRPDKFAKRRFGELKSDLNPEAPGPTEAETQLQSRQREEIARLDDEENVRLKRGLRGQLGSRRLLSSTRSRPSTSGGGGGSSTPSGSGRVGIPRRPGPGSYA